MTLDLADLRSEIDPTLAPSDWRLFGEASGADKILNSKGFSAASVRTLSSILSDRPMWSSKLFN